jgi:hypothetical protein
MPLPEENDAVSATEADWLRERMPGNWAASRYLLQTIRRYKYYAGRRGPVAWVGRRWNVLRHRFWWVVCGRRSPLTQLIGYTAGAKALGWGTIAGWVPMRLFLTMFRAAPPSWACRHEL